MNLMESNIHLKFYKSYRFFFSFYFNISQFIYIPHKIIGVCLQIFDSIIRDWLEPSLVPWEPLAKASDGEVANGKERDDVLVLGDATDSLTLCVKGGEFSPLLEVVLLHNHPFIGDEFVLTQSFVNDGESTRTLTHSFAFVIVTTFC
jgi:hypothetical protein